MCGGWAVVQDHACEAMELFDELIECEVAIVAPYLSPLLEFCLTVSNERAHTHTHTGVHTDTYTDPQNITIVDACIWCLCIVHNTYNM